MINWLLKKSIWATKAKKWHGGVTMMRMMSSTPSPAVSALYGARTYFGQILYIFWSFLGDPRFPQGGTKVKILNCYYLLCHGDTQTELVKHSLDPPCAFIYFLLSGLPLFGWFKSTLVNYNYIDPCIVC